MGNKISIIVPVYNCNDYLDLCVKKLLDQTYDNYEIILVDDGSTDGSYIKCKKWSKRSDKIIFYHQKNCGVSCARNLGIKKATGDYISFVDSDDLVNKCFLEKLLDGYKEDVQLSVVGILPNNKLELRESGKEGKRIITSQEASKFIFENKLFFGFPVNKLYRKDIIDKMGLHPFDEDIHNCEDTLFNVKYLTYCKKISFNKIVLYTYYQRESSATKTKKFNINRLSIFDALNRIEEIYKEKYIDSLVFLYKFYLYNYYLVKVLIYNSKSNYNLSKNGNRIKLKKIVFSKKVSLKEKAEIIFRYYFPILNDRLSSLKNKIKRS